MTSQPDSNTWDPRTGQKYYAEPGAVALGDPGTYVALVDNLSQYRAHLVRLQMILGRTRRRTAVSDAIEHIDAGIEALSAGYWERFVTIDEPISSDGTTPEGNPRSADQVTAAQTSKENQ